MKIAFLVTHFPRLSETFILNQITGLIDHGHEIDIYADEPGGETRIHEDIKKYDLLSRAFYYGEATRNIPANKIARIKKSFFLLNANFFNNKVVIINSLNIFKFHKEAASLKLLYKIIPFLNKRKYDVIQCHFGPNGNLGVLLKDLGVFSGKVITVFHGYDISQYIQQYGRNVYENLFKKGDLFLPISERWKNELISLGCREDKIKVHHMGIDPQKYNPAHRKSQNSDKIKILTIGRFVEKKGIRYGVEAVGSVMKEHANIEYGIIGDGPLRNEVESIIFNMNLRGKVKLLGWKSQEEIIDYIKDTDILLAPSVIGQDGDQEGIPVVLMEAMGMGLPVVSTYHSGIPELVQDNVSGFLAPERNVSVLAEKLKQCIDSRDKWPEIGMAGHKTVMENFNINSLNNQLVDIYRRLLNQ
jgi:colanic acid/amylovoran biosynthesis glycosyltransferase